MAKSKDLWKPFWNQHRKSIEAFDVARVSKSLRENLLSAREVLEDISTDWMPVWKRQNPAYWTLCGIGALEVRATFHWSQDDRRPTKLDIAVEMVGNYSPDEIYARANAAGMIPQSFIRADAGSLSSGGRFAHAVRRGPFTSGLQALKDVDTFIAAARLLWSGDLELPKAVASLDLLRSFEDGLCPVDGTRYTTFLDKPNIVFSRPQPMNLDDFTEEYRPPEEWRFIFSESNEYKEPMSARQFARLVRLGEIVVRKKSTKKVSIQLSSLPASMRTSKAARDGIVAAFKPVQK